MKLNYDVKRLASITILFASFASLAITTIPIASAMNSPDYGRDPFVPFEGQAVTLTYTGNAAAGAPHDSIVLRVLEPPGASTDVNNDETQIEASFPVNGQCDLILHNGDQIAWELRRDANSDTFYTMSERVSFILHDKDIIDVTFGNGNPAFTLTDVAPLLDSTVSPTSGTFAWVEVALANGDPDLTGGTFDTDTTDVIGNGGYRHGPCGTEEPNGVDFARIETFVISERIAGTVIPVDTTALLIAGATTNALWILPMIGAAATGFGIFTLKRKQN